MESSLVFIVVVGLGLVILLLAWRAVRFLVRLALLGLVAFLVIGLLIWWGLPRRTDAPRRDNRPAGTRRATNR
ncbi:MAG: hypothetical protein ACR2GW_12095 [Pyrinomonadaceae bacterium]